MGYHHCRSWSSRNDSRTCLRKRKQKVLLLDRQNQMGRKILVTGNGKCNLTNFAQKLKYYRSDCPEKVQNVLSVFGQKEAMKLFQSLGIYTKDKNGYVYPYSEQAASVREAFETEILSNPSITFVPFSEVYNVQKKEDVFLIKAKEPLGQSEQSTGKQGNSEKNRKGLSLSESPYHNRGICGAEVWL